MSRRVDDNSFDTRRADELMRLAVGLTDGTAPHPNPRVGAIVLSDSGTMLSGRAHLAAGEPHAEVAALAEAGEAARGGTLVTTLEPCVHYGRTPPCVDAIVAAGIARVFVGAEDPDERVSGQGIGALRKAGIDVVVGVERDAVRLADPGYFHHRETGMPRVTLKVAATLDGQAAAADHSSRWITGPEAREDAHRLRARSDAVVIGAGTLRDDDPRLDVRVEGYTGRQPRPVIVAGARDLPTTAAVYDRDPIVFLPSDHAPIAGVSDVVVVPGAQQVDLNTMLKHLGSMGLIDVLVEGGPTLAGSMLREGLVDRLIVYLGAKIAGGIGLPVVGGVFSTVGAARGAEIDAVARLGPDLRIDATIREGR
jgi:diaminohydroxyphosphoribosylaminopyrimidine deaminase / 5-amino-6-(5-phosphoribosylamino)uracil reductase